MLRFVTLAATGLCLSYGTSALGNPRQLAFSYPATTLPEGRVELEQSLNFIPVRVLREGAGSSEVVTAARFQLETELEYGVTDQLEVAWYFVSGQEASATDPRFQFKGVKQRARYRFGYLGQSPVECTAYLEVAELHNEIEFEEKLILTARADAFTFFTNLWVEQEWYFQADQWEFTYNPTFGVAYAPIPAVSLGAEYFMHGKFENGFEGSYHYAGPNLMLQAGEVWLTTGAYVRLDSLTKDVKVDDPWGKLWFRSVIGLGF
jgi:hypothetical protein